MPLTPLHLAAGLPVRRYISLPAFIIVNILIDIEPGLIMFFGMDSLGYSLHQGVHTLGGVTLMALVTLPVGFPYKGNFPAWAKGAFWGAYSHLFLDSLVHWDVEPFAPLLSGNPLYLDAYHAVSALCAAILAYYLARWVESLGVGEMIPRVIRNTWRRFFPGTPSE